MRWLGRKPGVAAGLIVVGVLVLIIVQSTTGGRSFALRSSAFRQGGTIPKRYTCSGAGVSPPLAWSEGPQTTNTYALLVTDPDARGGTFTHWAVWNLPSSARSLPAGAHPAFVGVNSFGEAGYGGPCPPPGPAHGYVFRLYAVDNKLKLPSGSPAGALQAHGIIAAQLTGRFGR